MSFFSLWDTLKVRVRGMTTTTTTQTADHVDQTNFWADQNVSRPAFAIQIAYYEFVASRVRHPRVRAAA